MTQDRWYAIPVQKYTWTDLHRIGTGLSIADDILGDKQSKMTQHNYDRMQILAFYETLLPG